MVGQKNVLKIGDGMTHFLYYRVTYVDKRKKEHLHKFLPNFYFILNFDAFFLRPECC